MEKPVINLHIGTLIGKIEIVNLPFDEKIDLSEQSLSQLRQIQSVVESSLLEILKKSNIVEETSERVDPDDIQKKEPR